MLRSKRTPLLESEVDEIITDIQDKHRRWLDDLLGHHNLEGLDVKIHLLKGNAGKIIPSLVKKQLADIVVMGTVSRTGVGGFFIGNTAEKIIRNVDCSVLTIKPDSFETPIKV
jgi:nucleotide-binding universal stress UspA family protein